MQQMMHIHVLVFKEIAEDIHIGFELVSDTSRYRKLTVNNRYAMNYADWKYWCSSELFM